MSCKGRYVLKGIYGSNNAPVKKIQFSNPINSSRPIETEALLDTGASQTFIPKKYANELALEKIRMSKTYDYRGKPTGEYPVYVVTVTCDGMTNNVQAIETDGFAIIGRDILNSVEFILTARQGKWEMS